MRKATPPHRLRIRLADGAAIPGHECSGYSAGRAGKCLTDMRGQPGAKIASPARFSSGQERDRPQCPARGANALKPGDTRIIIGSGHGRIWRRHQPSLEAYLCAGCNRDHDRIGVDDIDA